MIRGVPLSRRVLRGRKHPEWLCQYARDLRAAQNFNDLSLPFCFFQQGPKTAARRRLRESTAGRRPHTLLHQCMTFMAGTALIATAVVAGAAVVVRARTGPATSEPMVPTVRMAGARMFRRMRMFLPPCVYRGHCLDPGFRRPGHERRCSCFSFTSLWLIT